jgi:hypothetical protein
MLLDVTPGKITSRKFWNDETTRERAVHVALIEAQSMKTITEKTLLCSYDSKLKGWAGEGPSRRRKSKLFFCRASRLGSASQLGSESTDRISEPRRSRACEERGHTPGTQFPIRDKFN